MNETDNTKSLLTPEMLNAFQHISDSQEQIINKAAAEMYAAIHRGERDIDRLYSISDPLFDEDWAGEEHAQNLISYVATFCPTEALHMRQFYEDINGFREHVFYATLQYVETLYTPEEFTRKIAPLPLHHGDWQETSLALLLQAQQDEKLPKFFEFQKLLEPKVNALAADHATLWNLVDQYDEHWCKYPNEVYHPLSDIEWDDLAEAYWHAHSGYFKTSTLTAQIRIIQLKAQGQEYGEEAKDLYEFIHHELEKQDTMRKTTLPTADVSQPSSVAPLYYRFQGFWSPDGSSYMPPQDLTTQVVPITSVASVNLDDQYLRLIPRGIPYNPETFAQPCWIAESNLQVISIE